MTKMTIRFTETARKRETALYSFTYGLKLISELTLSRAQCSSATTFPKGEAALGRWDRWQGHPRAQQAPSSQCSSSGTLIRLQDLILI